MSTATVRVEREAAPWRDRLRTYKIVVDGTVIGGVTDGATADLLVEPGDHTLRLKVDWTGSPTVRFAVDEGGCARWVCRRNGSAWSTLWRCVFTPRRYISLKSVAP